MCLLRARPSSSPAARYLRIHTLLVRDRGPKATRSTSRHASPSFCKAAAGGRLRILGRDQRHVRRPGIPGCNLHENVPATVWKRVCRRGGDDDRARAERRYYDGTVQKSCSDEAALARMGALAAIEHACVHLAGAASLADSADFESKGCVRSILDV